MSSNGSVPVKDGDTEVFSQGGQVEFTGRTCSESFLDEDQFMEMEDSEDTEIVSPAANVELTGLACPETELQVSQESAPVKNTYGNNKISDFDPDETFIDSNLINNVRKNYHIVESNDPKASGFEEEVSGDLPGEASNLSYDSQESTQPVIPSQDLCSSPPQNTIEDISDEKQESAPHTYSSQPTKLCMSESSSLSESSKNEKLSTSSAVATSTSSSQAMSNSSSKAGESDDSDIVQGSQDIFASEVSFQDLQKKALTVSQLLPTLQLSGNVSASQSYEGFVPSRIHPTSPTDLEGLTSTPKADVISISDEEICFEEDQMLGEKRKLSDSSVESKGDNNHKAKRYCFDGRQSIELLRDFNSSKRSLSVADSQDVGLDSQGFCLQLSQSDPEIIDSQTTEFSNSLNKENSWKSHSGSIKEAHSSICTLIGPSSQDGKSNHEENRNSKIDISIVQLDDLEDEIQLVSPTVVKSIPMGEITLDSSDQIFSSSADIEVLSPSGNKDTRTSKNSELGINTDKEKQKNSLTQYNVESSPFRPEFKNLSSSFDLQSKIKHSTPHLQSPNGKDHDQDVNDSKENLHPDEHEFEGESIYTCTFRVVHKTVIDMNKREVFKNMVPKFEILELRTTPTPRRDTSPSAVENYSSAVTGGSPGSVASGPGPFPVQPTHLMRMSMFSTTSSSSAGSSASAWHRPAFTRRRQIPPVPLSCPQDSTSNNHGPVPWYELIQQHKIHDDLCRTIACNIEEWASGLLNNSSSDDSRTIAGKCLDPVLENDNEDVLGVPPMMGQNPSVDCRKRNNSSTNSTVTSFSISKESQNTREKVNNESEIQNSSASTKRKRGRPLKSTSSSKTTPSGSAKKKDQTPKKKVQTPKKKDPTVLISGDQSSAHDDSTISSESDNLAPGCPVFAIWGDGFFYPGEIVKLARPNHYNVVFHDKAQKILNRKFIYPISTFQIGQSLRLRAKIDESYQNGEVVAVTPLVGEESELYTIKLRETGECVTVTRSDLCLTEEQAKQCSGECCAATTSCSSSPSKRSSESKAIYFDLEKNVIPGKRIRTPKANHAAVNSPSRAGPSSASRKLIQDSSSSSATEDEPLATALIPGVQPEQIGHACLDPLVRKGKGVKNSSSKKPFPDRDDPEALKIYGPLPPEGSRIFAGYSFLITTTDVRPKDRRKPPSDVESEVPASDAEAYVDSSQYETDSECFKFSKAPMSKDRLARQILKGGGKVLTSWTDIPLTNIKNTYVVSNRPCLTAIFILCLARGIRCVVQDHIINCCKENKQFAADLVSYTLPAGHSLLTEKWIRWNELKNKCPLKGENIIVVGENKAFKQFWINILKIAGASAEPGHSSIQIGKVTKFLSENPCPDSVLKEAKYHSIPVVSPTWVIQSLINNKALPHHVRADFAHDFQEA